LEKTRVFLEKTCETKSKSSNEKAPDRSGASSSITVHWPSLGVRELAELSKVSTDTIVRFERGEELRPRTVEALQAALEAAGVLFIDQNGEGPGVRLRKGA
jgi:transcriptional regulator with XRE-family HTH domain